MWYCIIYIFFFVDAVASLVSTVSGHIFHIVNHPYFHITSILFIYLPYSLSVIDRWTKWILKNTACEWVLFCIHDFLLNDLGPHAYFLLPGIQLIELTQVIGSHEGHVYHANNWSNNQPESQEIQERKKMIKSLKITTSIERMHSCFFFNKTHVYK